jgi:hypothetical protein
MVVLNLTPHEIVVYGTREAGAKVLQRIPSDGYCRLVGAAWKTRTRVSPIHVLYAPEYSAVEGLPADKNACIIVSMLVAEYLVKNNAWEGLILAPATDPDHVVRDKDGQILGVTAFYGYRIH